MQPSSRLALQLRNNLPPVLDGHYSPCQLNTIVNICVALASELIERKWRSRKLLQGMSDTDLAFDCIAEMFQQDDQGRLVQIEAYFDSVGLRSASDEELLVYLRRLVYAKVNQGFFRIYQDVDPVFSKILRNVKIAVDKLGQFEEIDRFGETFLAPLLCDKLLHLPLAEQDVIERHLLSVCTGVENVPRVLAEIALYLRSQDVHSRMIALMAVARTIQSMYEIKNRPLLESGEVHPDYDAPDTTLIVKSACAQVKQEMYAGYVEKGKVCEDVFNTYFETIEASMINRFVEGNGAGQTYFDLLKVRLADLTLKQYRSNHRAKLEYLGKLATDRTIKALKNHLG